MIGFASRIPFLGGMDKNIAPPRKETPRLAIAPGSVGIAGKQTGVYPLETPGGWQIIGRTPQRLFLPEISPPTLLQPGDKLRFADRKSTRLNSSHVAISYAVFCLKKKKKKRYIIHT